jgi:hypothetical protein
VRNGKGDRETSSHHRLAATRASNRLAASVVLCYIWSLTPGRTTFRRTFMIQASIQVPAPPTAPTARAGQVVTTRDLNPAPMTAQELATLRARRRELSDQLISANDRRKALANQARTATGAP